MSGSLDHQVVFFTVVVLDIPESSYGLLVSKHPARLSIAIIILLFTFSFGVGREVLYWPQEVEEVLQGGY